MSVIWITGLAGAGKSSIAQRATALLRARGHAALLLDGDAIRNALGEDGVDRATRRSMAYRMARLGRLVAAQDTVAVIATVSLFHEVHAFNRRDASRYFEVLVRCPPPLLRERCALYRSAPAADVVGLGQTAEFPLAPHLVLDNDGPMAALDALAAQLVEAWARHDAI